MKNWPETSSKMFQDPGNCPEIQDGRLTPINKYISMTSEHKQLCNMSNYTFSRSQNPILIFSLQYYFKMAVKIQDGGQK